MRVRITLSLGAMLAVAACGSSAKGPTINFGALVPLTGGQSEFSGPMTNGILAAQSLINSQGGLLGKQLAVQVGDSNSPPPDSVANDAATAAQALITNERVVAIIGPEMSVQVMAAANTMEQAQIPLVAPYSDSPEVTSLSPRDYIYRLSSDYVDGIQITASDMHGLNIHKVVVMYSDAAALPQIANTLTTELAAIDPNSSVVNVMYTSQTDYSNWDPSTYVNQALAATPDAIYLNTDGDADAGQIINALSSQNFQKTIYAGDAIDTVPAGVGAAAAAGIRNITPYYSPTASTQYQAFLTAYEAWSNGNPPEDGGLEPPSFDSTLWVALAMEIAGTTSGPEVINAMPAVVDPNGTAVGPASYGDALSLIKQGKPIHWTSSTFGSFTLDGNHDPVLPYALYVCCQAGGFGNPVQVYEAVQ